MWVLAALGLVHDACAEDCFAAITFHVTLDVETTPPGAAITIERTPDPSFTAKAIGTSPLAWSYAYAWRWASGNCGGAAPDDSWGVSQGELVSSLEIYDTFSLTASLDGYEPATVPVRVQGCTKESTIVRKAYLGQLKQLAEVRQCALEVRVELTPRAPETVEMARTPLTAGRMLLGCTTDKDCTAESRCDAGVCVPR
jgi:hypothetical protein